MRIKVERKRRKGEMNVRDPFEEQRPNKVTQEMVRSEKPRLSALLPACACIMVLPSLFLLISTTRPTGHHLPQSSLQPPPKLIVYPKYGFHHGVSLGHPAKFEMRVVMCVASAPLYSHQFSKERANPLILFPLNGVL